MALEATMQGTAEHRRLAEQREGRADWKQWGPYLSERQWGTVREDYSPNGDAWDYLPHDHARSRAYRWGEDGLAGISDDEQRLCFALTLWNGEDPILKERLFGLTGSEGNHGEDVKEYYYFLDNTPTHSYMKALYKYPQYAFPYEELVTENRRRGREEPEYELIDTGAFAEDRYFDVTVEYAKVDPKDILIRITAINHGPDAAPLHLLPTLWFRNTWVWGSDDHDLIPRPELHAVDVPSILDGEDGYSLVHATHSTLGEYWLASRYSGKQPQLLFTENESNAERLWGVPNRTLYVKDGINGAVVNGVIDAVNPNNVGTKVAAHYDFSIAPGASQTILLRLSATQHIAPFENVEEVFKARQEEADSFYLACGAKNMSEDACLVQRQAFAGLLWSKQFYYYDVDMWLNGDPLGPPPPESHKQGRNAEWRHLNNADIISMPDTWEYPWYAAWDLAFHCIPLALVDPDFAKDQLILLLREWYMHPNGQLPAYEWAFSDVNPPVHAWAAWRVYKIERRMRGVADRGFLERVFHKLLLNFTWWVNRKDPDGANIFQGGFLGLDNIGVFDRSAPLPTGGHLEQSDGTSWMGMYCLNMLAIALELAKEDPAYEDVASKFFEHFVYIAHAMNDIGIDGMALWDNEDGFYYDVLRLPDGSQHYLKIRSMVGLIPLFAVETLEPEIVDRLPGFKRRMQWFVDNHPDIPEHIEMTQRSAHGVRRLLSLVNRKQLKRVLARMLDENEFFSSYGIRALSRFHLDHPYEVQVNDHISRVSHEPAESATGLFGGNSNWRGPIWFPVNYLLVESLQKFHHYYGEDFKVECPTHSNRETDLWQVSAEISRRLIHIFLRDRSGRRPVAGGTDLFQSDPHWRDLILFYEYFHGDNGAGLGASHQTGWTGLVAKLLEQSGE